MRVYQVEYLIIISNQIKKNTPILLVISLTHKYYYLEVVSLDYNTKIYHVKHGSLFIW